MPNKFTAKAAAIAAKFTSLRIETNNRDLVLQTRQEKLWETGVSRHHGGTIKGSPLNPSIRYCCDTVKVSGGPSIGPPRDAEKQQSLGYLCVWMSLFFKPGCETKKFSTQNDMFRLVIAHFVNWRLSRCFVIKLPLNEYPEKIPLKSYKFRKIRKFNLKVWFLVQISSSVLTNAVYIFMPYRSVYCIDYRLNYRTLGTTTFFLRSAFTKKKNLKYFFFSDKLTKPKTCIISYYPSAILTYNVNHDGCFHKLSWPRRVLTACMIMTLPWLLKNNMM